MSTLSTMSTMPTMPTISKFQIVTLAHHIRPIFGLVQVGATGFLKVSFQFDPFATPRTLKWIAAYAKGSGTLDGTRFH